MKNYFINGKSMVMVMHGALHAVKYNNWFPVDTANLRENATYLSPDGFTIVFDEDKAPYIPYLEFGTYNSTKHIGFIKDKSSITATRFIARQLNGKEIFYTND